MNNDLEKKCKMICIFLYSKINKINNFNDYKKCKDLCIYYYDNKGKKLKIKKIKNININKI
jgi:hypothetical protein